jgi:hypothetical protein
MDSNAAGLAITRRRVIEVNRIDGKNDRVAIMDTKKLILGLNARKNRILENNFELFPQQENRRENRRIFAVFGICTLEKGGKMLVFFPEITKRI